MKPSLALALIAGLLLGGLPVTQALAQSRNASFMNPSAGQRAGDGKGGSQLPVSVVADPAQVDAGETLVNVARRVTVFFYNGYRNPVTIADITMNADGNVRGKIVSDDCKTLKSLPVNDRCSVAVEVTPNSPGPWTVELLLNHSGQGRITRAEIVGTTLGKTGDKSEGLAISKKIAQTLDFGSVNARAEKATRTMLIENDSNDQLVISTIDLIAQEGEGLALRGTGCKEGDKLKPGESCPITVMWAPASRGNLATDLIVRHNGSLGFVVVPIRGAATMAEGDKGTASTGGSGSGNSNENSGALVPRIFGSLPLPPSQPSLPDLPSASQIAQTLLPIKSSSVTPPVTPTPASPVAQDPAAQAYNIPFKLIGTVGGRAILSGQGQETAIVGLGETAFLNGYNVELLQLDTNRAVISVEGIRKELGLRKATSFIQSRSSGSPRSGPQGATDKKDSQNPGSSPVIPQAQMPDADPAADAQIAPVSAMDPTILN